MTAGQRWLAVGAVLGLIGVGTGAFGAHGLESMMAELLESDPELAARRLDNWKTAADYQLIHALAIGLTGLALQWQPRRLLHVAAWAFLIGVLIFSGMLYGLVLSEQRILGAIVPIGGVSFMLGWGCLAWSGFTRDGGSSSS